MKTHTFTDVEKKIFYDNEEATYHELWDKYFGPGKPFYNKEIKKSAVFDAKKRFPVPSKPKTNTTWEPKDIAAVEEFYAQREKGTPSLTIEELSEMLERLPNDIYSLKTRLNDKAARAAKRETISVKLPGGTVDAKTVDTVKVELMRTPKVTPQTDTAAVELKLKKYFDMMQTLWSGLRPSKKELASDFKVSTTLISALIELDLVAIQNNKVRWCSAEKPSLALASKLRETSIKINYWREVGILLTTGSVKANYLLFDLKNALLRNKFCKKKNGRIVLLNNSVGDVKNIASQILGPEPKLVQQQLTAVDKVSTPVKLYGSTAHKTKDTPKKDEPKVQTLDLNDLAERIGKISDQKFKEKAEAELVEIERVQADAMSRIKMSVSLINVLCSD